MIPGRGGSVTRKTALKLPTSSSHLYPYISRVVIAVEDLSERIDDDDRREDRVEKHDVVALGDLQPGLEVLHIGDILKCVV
jgi:hypothetical protein